MTMTEKLNLHAELMSRMAEAVHADLGEALIRGQLSGEQLRGAVMRCTTCDSTAACEHWVETHGETTTVPAFCANHDLMARLSS